MFRIGKVWVHVFKPRVGFKYVRSGKIFILSLCNIVFTNFVTANK